MSRTAMVGVGLFLFAFLIVFVGYQNGLPRTIAVAIDQYDDSTLVAQRQGINLISGDGLVVTGADDSSNSRVDFTLDVGLASGGGLEFSTSTASMLRSCSDGQVLKWTSPSWACASDATGAGGSAITLDLGDDSGNDSADLTEIATTGDTNSIFTEPTADKLLIAVGNNWPTADAATALSANPADCAGSNFATTIAANGDLTCAQPAFSDLSGAATDGQIPDTITIDLAGTATALAADPSDCGSNTFAQSIAASGNLTCANVDLGTADVTGTLDVSDHLNLAGGTNITLTGDTLNVDDAFLLNTGDVGTGVFDFGGATSIEIPNGDNPTVDATGEIAIDTTSDHVVYYGTDTVFVLSPRRQVSITIESPADADNFLIGKLQEGITITDVHCIVDPADSAESVVIDVQERDATGDSPASFDATITCDNDGAEDDGAISNASFDAGDWWSVDIGTVTGTVTQVDITIYYFVTRT